MMHAIPMRRKMLTVTLLLAMVAALLPTAAGVALAAGPPVFINEIHYDNAGADSGEAVEIAGPAGTNLSGWSIVLYNGSATQLNVYDTIALSGTIPDQSSGYGTLSFLTPGMQNGAPDGLALVDASNGLVEFLSYEGTFTPVNGPAAGQVSVDIGVSENGSGAVGNSLQRTGTGIGGGDFVWAPEQSDTFGAVNTGADFR